jgi:hypothetical protein
MCIGWEIKNNVGKSGRQDNEGDLKGEQGTPGMRAVKTY